MNLFDDGNYDVKATFSEDHTPVGRCRSRLIEVLRGNTGSGNFSMPANQAAELAFQIDGLIRLIVIEEHLNLGK